MIYTALEIKQTGYHNYLGLRTLNHDGSIPLYRVIEDALACDQIEWHTWIVRDKLFGFFSDYLSGIKFLPVSVLWFNYCPALRGPVIVLGCDEEPDGTIRFRSLTNTELNILTHSVHIHYDPDRGYDYYLYGLSESRNET